MEHTVTTGEEGFVLVFTLLLLVVVTLLGVSSIDTSVFESQMSANDALYKQSFYQADGGANVAAIVIEENISCPKGFKAMGAYSGGALIEGNVFIEPGSLNLWDITPTAAEPSDANRNAYFFYNAADPAGTDFPHTNITVGGVTSPAIGAGQTSNSGYSGSPGKSMAKGGANRQYDVFSQHIGNRQSESIVEIEWRHVIGLQGNCKY